METIIVALACLLPSQVPPPSAAPAPYRVWVTNEGRYALGHINASGFFVEAAEAGDAKPGPAPNASPPSGIGAVENFGVDMQAVRREQKVNTFRTNDPSFSSQLYTAQAPAIEKRAPMPIGPNAPPPISRGSPIWTAVAIAGVVIFTVFVVAIIEWKKKE